MKSLHETRERTTLAATGLAVGLAATAAGAGLWLRALASDSAANADVQSASVAAILLGVFLATCAGHEIWRGRAR
ncbi:hypothetical protein [Paraburkholderia sp.]|uniref:hypothetical protein n=1 Tax=Paraburkholderia sp. TaxID=1926495 RepID=UPI00286EDE65|nr:hypothetical protein [Paraburkholderia sp.]